MMTKSHHGHEGHDLLRSLRTARRRVRWFAFRTTMGPTSPMEHAENTVPVPHHPDGTHHDG
jgi:hypothetical protein